MTIAQLLCIIFGCIILILIWQATYSYPTAIIRKAYKMTKPTFNRALFVLSPNVATTLKGKRHYKSGDLVLLRQVLGSPGKYQTTAKGILIKQLGTTYKALAAQVKDFPKKCGIDIEQYSALTMLPPIVVRNLTKAIN